ncbi:hypothetical protein llap_4404 [Limosa lapponica baueri]|uniref:Uncharacterized protein n=1 Tax=Limosa lapponica baueri TaxID=1758121 RepID=A0A2I0UGX8_LIMLA|nr:hypothetical protein llap_4404 [Limosa lapponica baueri]
MITATQAASNLDAIDSLTCVGDHQVQYHIPSGRSVYYLAYEVIINVLLESIGLPTACCSTFPADVKAFNLLVAILQRQLFTLYPFLDAEDNPSPPPSPPVPSEQPAAIDSCTPVMGFVLPSFNNGN